MTFREFFSILSFQRLKCCFSNESAFSMMELIASIGLVSGLATIGLPLAQDYRLKAYQAELIVLTYSIRGAAEIGAQSLLIDAPIVTQLQFHRHEVSGNNWVTVIGGPISEPATIDNYLPGISAEMIDDFDVHVVVDNSPGNFQVIVFDCRIKYEAGYSNYVHPDGRVIPVPPTMQSIYFDQGYWEEDCMGWD